MRLHGDTRYGNLLLDNFGGEEWLGKTFAEKRRFLMHESVPKAVVTLHEIKRLAIACSRRESLLLVQFSIALKEEIIAL